MKSKNIFLSIAIIVSISCTSPDNKLPKSNYFKKIPSHGLNVYLEIKDNNVFLDGCIFSNYSSLRTPERDNDGPINLILVASKKTCYQVVDSVLHKLGKELFFKTFFAVNSSSDSTVIPIFNPHALLFTPQPEILEENNMSPIIAFSIKNGCFLVNDKPVNENELKEISNNSVKNNQPVMIVPNSENTHAEIIHLLDTYKTALYDIRDSLSLDLFQTPYNELSFERSEKINDKYTEKIVLSPLKADYK